MRRIFLFLAALPAFCQTPTVIQRATCTNTYVSSGHNSTGGATSYSCPLPELAQGGNTAIFAFRGSDSGTISGVTDDKADSFTLAKTVDDSGKSQASWVYYGTLTAGAKKITASFAGSQKTMVSGVVVEVQNLGALDVTSGTAAASATMSAGSLTPTVTGDWLLEYAFNDNTSTDYQVSSFTVGSQSNITWKLLTSDTIQGNSGSYVNGSTTVHNFYENAVVTQAGVYSSTSAINPQVTQVGGSGNNYIAIAVAFEAASAGAAPPAGMRIAGLSHWLFLNNGATSETAQLPCVGDSLLVVFVGGSADDITGISDGTNTYTSSGATEFSSTNSSAHNFYVQAANCSATRTLTITFNQILATQGDNIWLYDIIGGSQSALFDSGAEAKANGSQGSAGNLNMLTITPSKPNEMIIASMGVNTNGLNGLTGAGQQFDLLVWGNQPFNSSDPTVFSDENGAAGHVYVKSTSGVNITWTEVDGSTPAQDWAGRATALLAAQVVDVYLAASAGGTGDGSSCTNALAYTYFNTSGNWSAIPNGREIGPGTTVHICGTITDSASGTMFTAQGSGSSGNPVTIHCETSCILQSPGEAAFFALGSNSYFVLDGGGGSCGWVGLASVSCQGLIQNTLNGFSLSGHQSTCPGGTCTQQVQTQVITGSGSNIELKGWHIGYIYIHGPGGTTTGACAPPVGTGTNDCVWSSPGPNIIEGSQTNVNVHNNTFHDIGWALNFSPQGLTIANNEMYNLDHGFGGGQNNDSSNTISTVSIHDNYFHDNSAWDQGNNAFHHDGFHLFSYCATLVSSNLVMCPNTIITGVNIYNNIFGGNFGGNFNAQIFFEGNIQNASIFNNISVATTTVSAAILANGGYNGYGNTVNVFNNTWLGVGGTQQTYKIGGILTGPSITFRNNALTDAQFVSVVGTGGYPVHCPYTTVSQGTVTCNTLTNASYTLQTNAFMAPATFSNGLGDITNGFYNFNASGFTSFESDMSSPGDICRTNDSSPCGSSTTEPNGTWFSTTTGNQLTGSPTIGAGTNLTTLCTSLSIAGNPCNKDIAGNARPSSGAWDIGAYQGSSGPGGTGGTMIGGKGVFGGSVIIHP
jgi:hypothetical protein